jgi:hypothetical protein
VGKFTRRKQEAGTQRSKASDTKRFRRLNCRFGVMEAQDFYTVLAGVRFP